MSSKNIKLVKFSKSDLRPTRKVSASTKKYVNQRVARMGENKYLIPSATPSAHDMSYDAPYIEHLTDCSQGSTSFTRVGDDIEIKELIVNFKLAASVNTITFARVMIIQWFKDTNVDTPTLQDLITYYTNPDAFSYLATIDGVKRKFFKVLYDRMFEAQNNVSSETQNYVVRVRRRKFGRKKLQYNAGATGGRNMIYLLAFSNVSDASGNEPNITLFKRVTFKDI